LAIIFSALVAQGFVNDSKLASSVIEDCRIAKMPANNVQIDFSNVDSTLMSNLVGFSGGFAKAMVFRNSLLGGSFKRLAEEVNNTSPIKKILVLANSEHAIFIKNTCYLSSFLLSFAISYEQNAKGQKELNIDKELEYLISQTNFSSKDSSLFGLLRGVHFSNDGKLEAVTSTDCFLAILNWLNNDNAYYAKKYPSTLSTQSANRANATPEQKTTDPEEPSSMQNWLNNTPSSQADEKAEASLEPENVVPEPIDSTEFHKHKGLFLDLGLRLPGYCRTDITGGDNMISNTNSFLGFNFRVGTAFMNRIVIYGTLSPALLLGDKSISVQKALNGNSYTTSDNLSSVTGLLGLGAGYFFPKSELYIFLDGGIAIGPFINYWVAEDSEAVSKYTRDEWVVADDELSSQFNLPYGVRISIGKSFWISPTWTIGIGGFFVYTTHSDPVNYIRSPSDPKFRVDYKVQSYQVGVDVHFTKN
jgi:hypothetical protein